MSCVFLQHRREKVKKSSYFLYTETYISIYIYHIYFYVLDFLE